MSQERPTLNFSGLKRTGVETPVEDFEADKNYLIEQGELQPEAAERIAKASKGELKARLAAVLSRGIIQDRLRVDLPPDLHGEWVRNDPLEIRRLELLGFTVDKVYAPARALGSNADGSAVVGDVIFMTCDKDIKDVIEEIRHDDLMNTHAKKRGKVSKYSGDYNKEEEDFVSRQKKEDSSGVYTKPFSESEEHAATYDDIKRTLKSIDKQVTPFD